MDGKKEKVEDIRSLFSMDPDDPAFKAAWRAFKEKRGAGNLVTPTIVRQRAKVEILHCIELTIEMMEGCRQVARDEKATPTEKNKAAELAVMLLKAHENLEKRLNVLTDWRRAFQKVEAQPIEEKPEPSKSDTPRFYKENGG
jgi:hypothetical protein